MLVTTRGDKGSDDPDADPDALAALRVEETAGRVARARRRRRTTSTIPTASSPTTARCGCELVRSVRSVRPDVVCCPDPTAVFFGDGYFNHRDHRITGWATLDAVAPAAGQPALLPRAPRRRASTCTTVAAVYLSGTLEPNAWVDITATLERKIEALFCHASQLVETGDWFRQFLRDAAEAAGRAPPASRTRRRSAGSLFPDGRGPSGGGRRRDRAGAAGAPGRVRCATRTAHAA